MCFVEKGGRLLVQVKGKAEHEEHEEQPVRGMWRLYHAPPIFVTR